MTDDQLITNDQDLRRRTNRGIPSEWVQSWAEKQGVPPGLKPEVHSIPSDAPGTEAPPEVTLEYHWHWQISADPTGATRQIWFADGPLRGTDNMIPAESLLWTIADYPLGPDGPYQRYTYQIEQREDGLWIGRCEP